MNEQAFSPRQQLNVVRLGPNLSAADCSTSPSSPTPYKNSLLSPKPNSSDTIRRDTATIDNHASTHPLTSIHALVGRPLTLIRHQTLRRRASTQEEGDTRIGSHRGQRSKDPRRSQVRTFFPFTPSYSFPSLYRFALSAPHPPALAVPLYALLSSSISTRSSSLLPFTLPFGHLHRPFSRTLS